MKFWFTYPLRSNGASREFMSGDSILEIASVAERVGFDGIGFTDHPAPPHDWLQKDGHDALDPFVALAAVAGATHRLQLIPNILVMAYRSPLLVAKSAASMALVSNGRFVLAVGAGYLKGEFDALGVEFKDRNRLFDEALTVLKGVWTQDNFHFDGQRFRAADLTVNPKPGRLPIWIGGNGPMARERVAKFGHGWNPFRAPADLAVRARSTSINDLDTLARLLEDLWRRLDDVGRDPAEIDVAFTTGLPGPGELTFEPESHLRVLARMSGLGVTWSDTIIPAGSLAEAVEAIERYGVEVIRKF